MIHAFDAYNLPALNLSRKMLIKVMAWKEHCEVCPRESFAVKTEKGGDVPRTERAEPHPEGRETHANPTILGAELLADARDGAAAE